MEEAIEKSTKPSGFDDFLANFQTITLATGLILLENLVDGSTRENFRRISHSPFRLAVLSNTFFYDEDQDPDRFVNPEIFAHAAILHRKAMRERGWDVAIYRDESSAYVIPDLGYLRGKEYSFPTKIRPMDTTDTDHSLDSQIAALFLVLLSKASFIPNEARLKFPIKSISHLFASRHLFGGYPSFPSDLFSAISKPKLDVRVLQEIRNELLLIRHTGFKSFSQIASDDKFVNDLYGSLEDTLEDDMIKAPLCFETLFAMTTSVNNNKAIFKEQTMDTGILQKIFSNKELTAGDFHLKKHSEGGVQGEMVRDEEENARTAAKVTVQRRVCDLLVHIAINTMSDGHSPTKYVATITSLLKQGGLTGKCLDFMSKFNITTSNSTYDTFSQKSLDLFYEKEMQGLLDAYDNITEADREESGDTAIVDMFDNYVKIFFAAEQRMGKEFTNSIVTMTNQMLLKRTNVKIDTRPERPATSPQMTGADIDGAIEYVRLGEFALGDILIENAEDVAEAKDEEVKDEMVVAVRKPIVDDSPTRLSHFKQIGCWPIGTGSHANIYGFKVMQEHIFNGLGRTMEHILVLDPQFITPQYIMCRLDHDRVKFDISAPPIWHICCKHLASCLLDQPFFLQGMYHPFLIFLKFKPSTFNANMLSRVDELVTEDEVTFMRADAAFPAQAVAAGAAVQALPAAEALGEELGEEENEEDEESEREEEEEKEEEEEERDEGGSRQAVYADEILFPLEDEQAQANGMEFARQEQDAAGGGGGGGGGGPPVPLGAEAALQAIDERGIQDKLNHAAAVLASLVYRRKLTVDYKLKQLKKKHDPSLPLVPSLPPAIVKANADEQKIVDDCLVSAGRRKFLLDLLHHAILYAEPQIQASGLWGSNPLTQAMESMCKDQLHLVVQPYCDIVGQGNISLFFTLFPKMVRLISAGGLPQIFRAAIYLLCSFINLKDNRPDILKLMARICTCLNEVFMEHQNSIISRLAGNLLVSFQKLRDLSIQSHFIKNQHDQLDRLFLVTKWVPLDFAPGVPVAPVRFPRFKIEVGEMAKKKRETGAVDTLDQTAMSEPQFMAQRFKNENTREGRQVKHCAVKFILPLLAKMGRAHITPRMKAVLDGYRPIDDTEQIPFCELQCKEFKDYLDGKVAAEKALVEAESNPLAPVEWTLWQKFWHQQSTKNVHLPVLRFLRLRPAINGYNEKLRAAGRILYGPGKNRKELILRMDGYFDLLTAPNSTDENKIAEYKLICKSLAPTKIPVVEKDLQAVTFAKVVKSYAKCVQDAPTKEESLRMFKNLKFDPELKKKYFDNN